MKTHIVIYYDGQCPFCNFWVRQLCYFDHQDHFRFSPLQKAPANIQPQFSRDALVMITKQREIKEGAEAIFYALKQQNNFLSIFLIFSLLPKKIVDNGYNWVAKNRYQWFGKHDHCPLPKARFRDKFIG